MKKLMKLFYKKINQTDEEKYLSESTSLEDIEYRQRLISRGEAPFQKNRHNWLQGVSYQ